ncbi:PREDICTED: ankyrin repeat and SAM domain-containing protein 3-like isoform X2 [Amphimedon queenslandica]|uniref:SAM domain-containing protein n=1 Tax=Amphimedon queenslandica TaxID=400682 RepID=A0A1X7TZR7_AMPQE|nr:PREDICTED: ankyrin repeat and SAM domain-containing protein 3-like isoform X2 [Amphimedon queenslandica]|eukprot:XP_003389398.2 PREDICTED: ankyrin repeat and SAM domain-containing protein 3-like isoform X2 [Amphimedon queenslandica]
MANQTTGAVESTPAEPPNWMEQTQYIARTIYDDPSIGPIPLDLYSACAIGKYESVQEAVNKKEDLNTQNKGGWTPLMYAAYVGHDTVVNLLLDSHADPNKGTPSGLTPLMVASGCGNESVCYFLIQNGAMIDQQDNKGCTALYHATRQGHQSTVQLLLKEGADTEIGDYQSGYTPLMIAAKEGDQIVLDVLVACRADINAKAYDGYTARSLALRHNHIKTVSFLDEIQMLFYPRSNSVASNESDLRSVSSTDEDPYAGLEEVDPETRKDINQRLGNRSGLRWSLPTMPHRASLATTSRRLKFRPSYSMPESQSPPSLDEECLEESTQSHEDNMAKLDEFLEILGLERYYQVFECNEIDFYGLLELSEEDLKRLVTKMGPRRKLQMAIKEMKEQLKVNESAGSSMGRSHDITPTPQRSAEKDLQIQVMQLKSTNQQLIQNMDSCEQRLAKEHDLRKMAERYCQELQKCRIQSLESTKVLKETLVSVLKHCQSLRSTQSKLLNNLKDMKLEGSHSKIQDFYTCLQELGGEIEAVSRSTQEANKEFKSVRYHLSSSFQS